MNRAANVVGIDHARLFMHRVIGVSLADGLARLGRNQAASDTYQAAIKNWSILRDSRALSAEDAHRAETTADGLAATKRLLGRP